MKNFRHYMLLLSEEISTPTPASLSHRKKVKPRRGADLERGLKNSLKGNAMRIYFRFVEPKLPEERE